MRFFQQLMVGASLASLVACKSGPKLEGDKFAEKMPATQYDNAKNEKGQLIWKNTSLTVDTVAGVCVPHYATATYEATADDDIKVLVTGVDTDHNGTVDSISLEQMQFRRNDTNYSVQYSRNVMYADYGKSVKKFWTKDEVYPLTVREDSATLQDFRNLANKIGSKPSEAGNAVKAHVNAGDSVRIKF